MGATPDNDVGCGSNSCEFSYVPAELTANPRDYSFPLRRALVLECSRVTVSLNRPSFLALEKHGMGVVSYSFEKCCLLPPIRERQNDEKRLAETCRRIDRL